MLEQIQALAQKLSPRLIEIRRHLHSYPELSGQEYETSAYVAGVLSSYGIKVTEGVGKTGIVGDLNPDSVPSGDYLAIRTDMDALPINELTRLPFSSKKPGIMHACGHDVHTTVGLGTAMVLSELSAHLNGRIKFLFQPAEEIAQGAGWMIQAGVMDQVEAILACHVFPTIPAGQIGIRYGALTAAADNIEIKIIGESGHGARPHEAIDAIWLGAQVITTLQQAISRTHNPLRPVVLTIGQIKGGRAPNVIADQVTMKGTVRSLHPETHENLPGWIEKIVKGVCEPFGATCQVNYERCVPSVQNCDRLSRLIEKSAQAALGENNVQRLPEPSLGAEDFAMFLSHVPGAMFRLGVGFKDRPNYPLHHPNFDVDEEAIATGVVTLAYAAYQYWNQN